MKSDTSAKAKALADGVEVWCSLDKLVPVGDLKPNPRNPNTHPAKQVELLAKNIRYFGWMKTGYLTLQTYHKSYLILLAHISNVNTLGMEHFLPDLLWQHS